MKKFTNFILGLFTKNILIKILAIVLSAFVIVLLNL